jgi:hypothetical protein
MLCAGLQPFKLVEEFPEEDQNAQDGTPTEPPVIKGSTPVSICPWMEA